jgi:hypothetical protein
MFNAGKVSSFLSWVGRRPKPTPAAQQKTDDNAEGSASSMARQPDEEINVPCGVRFSRAGFAAARARSSAPRIAELGSAPL